jgi:lysophospholipase L1-like esterase
LKKLIEKVLILTGMAMCASTAFSQPDPPPCLKPEHNKIIYPADSSEMQRLFKKIDELQMNKRKKVTVIHYGGSHVEAGHWDETFQENLQNTITKFEGGGVWAFPFNIMHKSNSPPFYRAYTGGKWQRCRSAIAKENCSVFGMNGITANTSARQNDFAIALQENIHHKYFKTVKVYHNFNPAFRLFVDPALGSKFREAHSKKEGFSIYEFTDAIDSVAFRIEKVDTLNSSEFSLYGVSLETDEPGFYYACMGFNGANTKSYIDAELFELQLRTLKPDLIIFSIGVNDSQGPNFSRDYLVTNYDSLVAKVKRAAPDCAILFTTVTDNYITRKRRRSPNPKMNAAHEAILLLAEKHKAAYWDMYLLMGGHKSMALWTKAGLAAKDKVHFSVGGYHLLGKMMFDAFFRSYKYNTQIK